MSSGRLATRLLRARQAGFGRDFGLLWLSHGVSILGDVLYDVGVMVVVFERTGSALGAVGVMLAGKLPLTLLGPIAGTIVDRFPKRRVMVTMDLLRAALVLQLLWMLGTPTAPLWPAYLVVAGLASAKAFHDPARAATVPSLVPRSGLMRANALLSATLQASYGIGYGLGGLLVLSFGLAPIVMIDAVTFLVSAFAISKMHVPAQADASDEVAAGGLTDVSRGLSMGVSGGASSGVVGGVVGGVAGGMSEIERAPMATSVVQTDVAITGAFGTEAMEVEGFERRSNGGLRSSISDGFASVRAGAVYVRRHPLVRPLIVLEVMEFIPHGIWTTGLMLPFTVLALGSDAVGWGWQNAGFFAGTLLGALIATFAADRLSVLPGRVIVINAWLFAALTLGYALSPNLSIAIILASLYGPTTAMRDVAQDALLQANSEPRMLGRVFAARAMGTNLAFATSAPIFAWAADRGDIRSVYIAGALMYACTALYATRQRAIRGARMDGALA